MAFCEHCQGQRFDRARVLRVLRQMRLELQGEPAAAAADDSLRRALDAIRALDIPHLDPEEPDDPVVH